MPKPKLTIHTYAALPVFVATEVDVLFICDLLSFIPVTLTLCRTIYRALLLASSAEGGRSTVGGP